MKCFLIPSSILLPLWDDICMICCTISTIDHAILFASRGTFLSPLQVDGPENYLPILTEVVCVIDHNSSKNNKQLTDTIQTQLDTRVRTSRRIPMRDSSYFVLCTHPVKHGTTWHFRDTSSHARVTTSHFRDTM